MIIWFIVQASSLILLLALSAFFSSSETVLFSLSPLQLKRIEYGRPEAAAILNSLLSKPSKVLSVILIGNTFINVGAASLGFLICKQVFKEYGEAISIPAMTTLLLIFGEICPKRLGLAHAEKMAHLYAKPLLLFMGILAPLRKALEVLTHYLQPFFHPKTKSLSDEEFETAIDLSEESGAISEEEQAMLKAIVRLENIRAADVMTPRVDLRAIDLETPATANERIIRDATHAYLPVYEGDIDNLRGFLAVRRYLINPASLNDAVDEPLYVPELSPLNVILTQMRHKKRHVAAVVDEYGGFAGIVTEGDIIEEITGELYDELSRPQPLLQETGHHTWIVNPGISIEELNRRLGLSLKAEGADRLAGWITAHTEELAKPFDEVVAQGCRVLVLQTRKNRITLAQLEKRESPHD